MEPKLSVIIAVLDSHEVVKRQLLHFEQMNLGKDVEFIIVDDGSKLSVDSYLFEHSDRLLNLNYYLIETHDTRKWSQPCARNRGGFEARSERILMTDIDHILTKEAIKFSMNSDDDKIMFPRRWGILTKNGVINQGLTALVKYGLDQELYISRGLAAGMHHNTFMIKKKLFYKLDGYDEKFCGKYGGDDTDFSDRYSVLVRKNKEAKPHILGPNIYVYPDPNKDVQKVFHGLRR